VVQFGRSVAFEREDGLRQSYRIVGEDEADPARGSISYLSPLAAALLGKQVGDTPAFNGDQLEVLSVA
jgi:transcription elongation GreA/GreB family factor